MVTFFTLNTLKLEDKHIKWYFKYFPIVRVTDPWIQILSKSGSDTPFYLEILLLGSDIIINNSYLMIVSLFSKNAYIA